MCNGKGTPGNRTTGRGKSGSSRIPRTLSLASLIARGLWQRGEQKSSSSKFFSVQAPCSLCLRGYRNVRYLNHRDTEDTEDTELAQRNPKIRPPLSCWATSAGAIEH